MGGIRLETLLLLMLTRGYDVVVESMLGRMCRLFGWSLFTVVYSSLSRWWLICFLSRDLALVGESLSRKYWESSVRGIVGGQAIDAKFGIRLWNLLRMVDSGLSDESYRSARVVWDNLGGRSRWVRIPVVAFRRVLVKLRTKSGIARALVSRHPRPPLEMSSCAMRSE